MSVIMSVLQKELIKNFKINSDEWALDGQFILQKFQDLMLDKWDLEIHLWWWKKFRQMSLRPISPELADKKVLKN